MSPGLDSLKRRIAIGYTLYSLAFVLFFTFIATLAVEGIEEHLVNNRLRDVEKWAAPRSTAGLPVEMPAGLSFHRGADIPRSLRGLPGGLQEKDVDGVGLHILAGTDGQGDYVVVDHTSDYEKVEILVYSMFATSFVGFLAFSWFLGGYVARRLVTPVEELAAAVKNGAAELPLQDRNDELGTLSRAFAAHTDELRAVLERERFFTGDVSHELRSPLTVIMGAAEVLMANGGAPAQQATAERIYRAAQDAAGCVNVLLLLARAPDLAHMDAVDMDSVARREVETYRFLLAARPVKLAYQGGEPFSVRAPRELCSAVIGNLVRNACQYTQHGDIIVRLDGRRVIVEDSGPGLPAAVRAALAGQAAAPPSSASAGTGLGLALVRRICSYLGATLALDDRPGGGSIFTLEFP
ncbi:HAMP domain-containing sensor histidine kinase [Pseudoduganella ginsengisoli]|uniref:histidine kinase n=1 Tax=Pseudoduganella ginsengisoli TaxID=1462440 RepID=A0A6L6QAP1_9BURK|nr:HAMP domain-containing sensor histidine kinase [Pseudoduganella ginsengisoli]MTW06251.1 HAMP domain-containing protein [Pseudoduganella ginsengisoli]